MHTRRPVHPTACVHGPTDVAAFFAYMTLLETRGDFNAVVDKMRNSYLQTFMAGALAGRRGACRGVRGPGTPMVWELPWCGNMSRQPECKQGAHGLASRASILNAYKSVREQASGN